jgi:hypothetical protein
MKKLLRRIHMYRFLIIFLLLSTMLSAVEQVIVYNSDLALIKTEIGLNNLQKGEQYYPFDDITSRIQAESVVLTPKSGKVWLMEQNYEYDLADTPAILKKYLDKDIKVETNQGNVFFGKLQFFDNNTLAIKDKDNSLALVSQDEIQDIRLMEMPANFYLKPTLRWKLNSDKKQDVKADLSYLTGGLSWEAVYNMVWDDSRLTVNSWITLSNEAGKEFNDITLKLVAGEINRAPRYGGGRKADYRTMTMMDNEAAMVSESEFHDFHLYTVNTPVTINNKQSKQIQLYPPKSVDAEAVYEYNTYGTDVASLIRFINSEKNGLGIPLPAGKVLMYKEDRNDNQLALIGEDRINHTPKDEKVTLKTGSAFDLKGKTNVVKYTELGRSKWEREMEVELKNHSRETKKINVMHNFDSGSQIISPSTPLKKESAGRITFTVELKPDETKTITWTEKKN